VRDCKCHAWHTNCYTQTSSNPPHTMFGCCMLLTPMTVVCGNLLAVLAVGRMQQNCCCFNQKVCGADLGMTRAAVCLPGAFGVTYSTLPTTVLAHPVLSPASSRSATSSLYTPLSVWQSTMSRCAACTSATASVVQAGIACASEAHYSLLAAILEVAFPLRLAGKHSSQLHHATQLLCRIASSLSEHLHRC